MTIEIIHDVISQEISEREWTDAEIKAAKKAKTESDALQAIKDQEYADKLKARLALLDRLGLTDEEAKLLLS